MQLWTCGLLAKHAASPKLKGEEYYFIEERGVQSFRGAVVNGPLEETGSFKCSDLSLSEL